MDEELNLTFEQAQAELEQTVTTLQQGQLSLDETLRLYERGCMLASYCQQKLEAVNLKVSQLLARQNGTFATKPIQSEKDVEEPGAPDEQPPPSGDGPEVVRQTQPDLFD